MAEQGKRLTCPVCKDSVWVGLAELEQAGGQVECANHRVGVEMVDLVALMEILGGPKPVAVEEVDFDQEDMNVLHPDDFDFEFSFAYSEEG